MSTVPADNKQVDSAVLTENTEIISAPSLHNDMQIHRDDSLETLTTSDISDRTDLDSLITTADVMCSSAEEVLITAEVTCAQAEEILNSALESCTPAEEILITADETYPSAEEVLVTVGKEPDAAAVPAIDALPENPAIVTHTEPLQTSVVVPGAINRTATNLKPALTQRRRIGPGRAAAAALLFLLLFSTLMPLSVSAGFAVSAYATYYSLRSHANNGVQHLLNIKTLFTSNGTGITNLTGAAGMTGVLSPTKLSQARQELLAARQDFTQVRSLLDHTPLIATVAQYLPQYRPQITTARAASQIGIDVANVGLQIDASALILAPKLHSPLLANSQTPLFTESDLALVRTTIDHVQAGLHDIQTQATHVSFNGLPVNAHQRNQIQYYIDLLPQIQKILSWARSMLDTARWLLGIDQPRMFLVQTMDRAELRPTGGFTGQYGELTISNGRAAPFSLHDISAIEYSDNSPTTDQQAPPAYRSWWPFANWGLRDSNLSADFPTSAQIAISQYKYEVKHKVDGVILFTPFLIEQVLQVTGPLTIPRYGETVTATNLEERLHYYQLDNAGIRRAEIIEHVNDPSAARKLFTSAVARTLMDRIRHASPGEMVSFGLLLLHALKTKDLQVYMTNPQLEGLLTQYGYAAAIDRSTTHDGLFIVQTNVSASKASQYVNTIVKDTVLLDGQGGATHTMQMRLVYNQAGPVFGLDTYRDYVRVYVPPTARFLWGDGFDTGVPLCGGPLAACPADGPYPQQELVCPSGNYQGGAAAPMLNDPYTGQWHPLDKLGAPTNFVSDEPGRAMFGGYVVVPKNCTITVALSWYVPPQGTAPYSLFIQRQAGTWPEINLTVLPRMQGTNVPGDCAAQNGASLYFNGVITEDTMFKLRNPSTASDMQRGCNMHMGA